MNYPQSGWYMASTGNIHPKYDNTIGQIESSGSIHRSRVGRPIWWCLDNGVFTGKFSLEKWLRQMDELKEYKERCLFVAIPDVVGDFHGTLRQFREYRKLVRDFPVAFVSQDGIMNNPNDIPWEEFDTIFVGGSDEHKLGQEGGWIMREAKKRGKWIHIGRVNSKKRLLRFWWADSWDGTTTSFAPSNILKMHAAVLEARSMKEIWRQYENKHS